MLALAFGAAKVLVAARDEVALARLKALDPRRVETIKISSETVSDQVFQLVPDGVDVMLDTLGAKAPAALSMDAMTSVVRGGRIIQIGGVAGPILIDPHPFMCAQYQYIGSLWFTTSEADEMVCMIQSGLLDMSLFEERTYPLVSLNEALADIVKYGDGFTNFTIVHD